MAHLSIALVLLLGLATAAHANPHETTLQTAKRLTALIEANDAPGLAEMLVGARVPRNFKRGTVRLRTLEQATLWLESGPGLETKGGETCRRSCCAYDQNDGMGWSDVPSHPRRVCFAKGRVTSMALVRGEP